MEHTTGVIDPRDRQESSPEVSATEVQRTLSEIFQSVPFHASKQSRELLRYIVDQTLAGHAEMLKERIIGANVFGRRPDYDTNDDPIVRARAAEVRKRLAQYYQTARGEGVVRIDVPSGSYRATFEWLDEKPALSTSTTQPGSQSSQPSVEALSPRIEFPVAVSRHPPSSHKLPGWGWLILVAASVVALAWAAQHYFTFPEERVFNQFWSPVLDNSSTVLIYVGSNAVYQLSSSYVDAYHRQHPMSQAEQMGLESFIPFPPGTKLNAEDLQAEKDTFVTIGDVAATTKIVSLLVRRNRQFDVRYGNDLVFGDLRESPTVLIGAHNNLWTIAMTDNLRFVFDSQQSIQDRSDPKRHWSANRGFTEDYAIVSRILNSKTGTTVVTAAGIGHAGTRAAAEFITNPHAIAALVKSLPKGWEKRNVQFVLHTTVINQLPSASDIVATYCW